MTEAERRRRLKKELDGLYRRFDRSMVSPDPLECVPVRGEFRDIELSAFLAAVFAYGKANLIVRNVRSILSELGPHPHRALMGGKYKTKFRHFKYRFHKRPDLIWLLDRLRVIYKKYGSVENAFCAVPGTLETRLKNFARLFYGNGKQRAAAQSFLIPSPDGGSACKRMNLFLRWMVRHDDVDLGLWKKLAPAELVIPLDVHVNRIAGRIGLVNPAGTANFKKARELTERLKTFNAADPVRYDFALCSLGKLGHCAKQPEEKSCRICGLAPLCSKT